MRLTVGVVLGLTLGVTAVLSAQRYVPPFLFWIFTADTRK